MVTGRPLALALGTVLFAATCAAPATAWADLRFCNRSASNVDLAIAYVEKDAPGTTTNQHRGVTLEGWWTLSPGECTKVSSIDAANHWVYYYADSSGGKWQGTSLLCVPSSAHTSSDRFRQQGESCPQSRRLRGFRRLDANTRTYTMNLRN
jgi:uncharacterized membrane protein